MTRLRRNPYLLARWLVLTNALHRFMRDRRRAVSVIGGALVAGFALSYATVTTASSVGWIEPLLSYWPLITLVAALHAATTAGRRLRRLEAEQPSFWLAAAPVHASSVRFAQLFLSLAPILLQWFAISICIAIVAGVEAASARSVLVLIGALSAGAAAGVLVGLWAPRSRGRRTHESSRYVFAKRAADIQVFQPSDAPLSRWPVSLTLSWSRPENARLLLLVALFGVQGGSSILSALIVIAMWVVAAYLGGLLTAVVHVSREASVWLRSTPMKFHAFAWPIARRTLLHQVMGTVGAIGVMVALGASLSMALYFGALWLAVVVMVLAISIAECYRGGSPSLRIALSLTTMAAIEIREHGWSIPFAVFLTAWQLRAKTKS